MNCMERKNFIELEKELERTKRIYQKRIDRMRNDRPRKNLEKLLDCVCILLIGGGIAWALQGVILFFTWLNVGW